jgi:hypothetical protein
MADTWLTIEQAAVALGLSVRTVNRHIVANKIQSRLNEGRREVLVSMPDEPADIAGTGSDAASPFAGERLTIDSQGADYARQASDYARQASDRVRQVSEGGETSPVIDPNTVLALADNAAEKAELAISAYQALARATDTQFRSVRRSARVAWAAVAVMAGGISVAVGWTTHHLTRAQVEGEHLQQQVRTTADMAEKMSAERETLRSELSAAREQAARAEGKVSALSDAQARVAPASAAATSQPTPDVTDQGPVAQASADEQASPQSPAPTTRPAGAKWLLDRWSAMVNDKGE